MPKLGLTMEEATIVEWLVADGELVDEETPIMVIETDKTETEVGSPGVGRLHHIGEVGEVYACGDRIGLLLAEDDDPSTTTPQPPPAPDTAMPAVSGPATAESTAVITSPGVAAPGIAPVAEDRVLASPNARRLAAQRGVALAGVRGTGPGGRILSEDIEDIQDIEDAASGAGAPPAADEARELAELLGIDLTAVPVSDGEPRVTRDAVAAHVRRLLQQAPAARPPMAASPTAGSPGASSPVLPPPPPPVAAAPAAPVAPVGAESRPAQLAAAPLLQEPVRTIRLTGMRGTIAKRMHASLREMAQLTLTMDADMAGVLADRAARQRRQDAPDAPDTVPSVTVPSITDYVLAATARALVRHPGMNAQVTAEGIAVLPEVHVGLAVAVDGGLLVPVVRDAAQRTLADLAVETTRLADSARRGTIAPTELEGATFSVSALGMYGVDTFTPVINPPNAGVLGIGRLRDDPVLAGGSITTAKRLTLSLTWDHRVLDGAPAAEFCRTIVELLAAPTQLD
jgi:pyruvate dehydrogenase E2 component (dihydrolipoamide acetyltransferase)